MRFTVEEQGMDNDNEQQSADLPANLIVELKRADRSVALITSRVDLQISQMAQAQFSTRGQPVWRSRPVWAAIAASVLIMVFVVESQLTFEVAKPIYADIDGSGRIDIADVLALARTRDSGESSQAEIDAFASQVVSLRPSGDAS